MAEQPKSKYLRKLLEQFPETSQRGIARIAYGEHPEWWTDYEAVRGNVRIICGTMGKTRRKKIIDKSLFRVRDDSHRPVEEFLPPCLSEYQEDWGIYALPRGKKWLILSDIHVPWHDVNALSVAINKGRDEGCDAVLLNGDVADMFSISYFKKDPTKTTIIDERELTIRFFDSLRDLFPDVPIIWKLGNHEERWEAYLTTKAPELFGFSEFDVSEVFKAKVFDIETIGDKRPLSIGKLHILHGHEFERGMFSPVNAARGLFLRALCTAATSHFHQTSFHTTPTVAQVDTSCWSIGCLCNLHPKYRPINRWNHGFAICDDSHTGESWSIYNFRIKDGEIRT